MKKTLFSILLIIILISCQNNNQSKSLQITGEIKGLKKGTLYIQKVKDTSFIALDTIQINGDSNFVSNIDLDEPQMLYLFLDRGVSNSKDNNINFFAEKGKINIQTSLDFFTADAKISGSKNQDLYQEYKNVVLGFVNQDLDIVEKKLIAYKNNPNPDLSKLNERQGQILRKKYLYTTNFAVQHSDYEVSPYITLAEISDINLKYLDTIQKSMTPKVAKSMYGKELVKLIEERKAIEN